MPKPRNSSAHLTFDDFHPSQPEPKPPKRHEESGVWHCDGCGAELAHEFDWCIPCIQAWQPAHEEWLKLNNAEFDEWYAVHRNEIEANIPTGSGIHNAGFLPDRIIEDRKVHFKDTLQPWREGTPSREFLETYPQQAKKMFTETERRKAKYVWGDAK